MSEINRPVIGPETGIVYPELLVRLTPSRVVASLILVFSALTLLFFLSISSYTKTRTVRGWLSSTAGVENLQAPVAGRVRDVFVKRGDLVEPGTVLFTIQSSEGDALAENVLALHDDQLNWEINSSRDDLDSLRSTHVAQQQTLAMQSEVLAAIALAYQRRYSSLDDALLIHQKRRVRLSDLVLQGHVAPLAAEQIDLDILALQGEIDGLQAALQQNKLSIEELEAQRREAERRFLQEENRLVSRLGELQLSTERQSSLWYPQVRARRAGKVDAILLQPGETVQRGDSVMALRAPNEKLLASLLIPPDSASALPPGASVNLRYDAYPYQQFGMHVVYLSGVSSGPVDVSAMSDMPFVGVKQAYLGRSTLTNEWSGGGESNKQPLLRPGLSFSADIKLETKSLLRWLMSPVGAIGERISIE